MEKLLAKILGPLVDKIPSGWKTVSGISVYLVLAVIQVLSPELAENYAQIFAGAEAAAFALFGVGVVHPRLKQARTPTEK